MTSTFSEADKIPDPFGAVATAFHVREALYPTLAPDMAATFGQMQRLQLDLFGNILKLWLLPLSAIHDAPDPEAAEVVEAPKAEAPAAVVLDAAVLDAPVLDAPVLDVVVSDVVVTPQAKAAGIPPASSREDPADDLQRIIGIGPKLRETLHALGIRRFHQIAALSPAEVASLNNKIGFKGRIEREGWQAQASRLSKASNPPQAA